MIDFMLVIVLYFDVNMSLYYYRCYETERSLPAVEIDHMRKSFSLLRREYTRADGARSLDS
jgi:hypothetical protein